MAGFEFAFDLCGNAPVIETYVVKASAVLSEGEMGNLETGEIDAGASGDTRLVGAVVAAVDNTVDGHSVKVITNPFAVYRVTDANARVAGETLDLASGGMGVTTSSNKDFMVYRDSAADEDTLVIFNQSNWILVGVS